MSADLIAIQQLLSAYCHRVDRGDAAEVAALFCPDGVLKPHYDGPYELVGREAVQSWYAFYHENFRAGVRHLKHMITSPLIEVDGDTGTGVAYLLATAVDRNNGQAFMVTGTYYDRYERNSGAWLFAERRIEVEAMTNAGEAIETFPPLNFPAPPQSGEQT